MRGYRNAHRRVVKESTLERLMPSPVFRDTPGFVGGGFTAGRAREFIIPNGPVPAGATITKVGP